MIPAASTCLYKTDFKFCSLLKTRVARQFLSVIPSLWWHLSRRRNLDSCRSPKSAPARSFLRRLAPDVTSHCPRLRKHGARKKGRTIGDRLHATVPVVFFLLLDDGNSESIRDGRMVFDCSVFTRRSVRYFAGHTTTRYRATALRPDGRHPSLK